MSRRTVNLNDHERYFHWLIRQIDSPNGLLERDFDKLLRCMNRVEFRWYMEKDRDREVDALDMRENYRVRNNIGPDFMEKPVSFLEFLVAMLVRYNDFYLTEPGEPSLVPVIFHEIMGTMGLFGYNNDDFDLFGDEKVCNFLCNFFVKNKKLHIFGVENEEKLDFWTACGVFLRDFV